MKIREIIKHSDTELIQKLREVRLRGFGQPRIYADCDIEVTHASMSLIQPPQNYYLQSRVYDLLRLNDMMISQFGHFLFEHRGYTDIILEDGTSFPFLPPIVESYGDGENSWLVCDGVHRVMAQRWMNDITPLVVEISRPSWPYYAVVDPELKWEALAEIKGELPDAYKKKTYRLSIESGSGRTVKDGGDGFALGEAAYKGLFRDFNAVWPGVQEERKKGLVG